MLWQAEMCSVGVARLLLFCGARGGGVEWYLWES